MDKDFEPKILTFTCNWCSYVGADFAGVSRFQYPPNIRIIRLMCSGEVDPEYIFEGFLCGADGILVTGCHPGDCHYMVGNYHAERKIKRTKRLLGIAEVNSERLYLVSGCHPGECHYMKGNYYTRRRMTALKRLLKVFGFEPERVRLEWVSASEGIRFAQVVREFTETTKSLGPNPLRFRR